MRFAKRFKLRHKLGSGSFGDVYLCKDLETGKELACKLEDKDADHGALLKLEHKIYSELHDAGFTDGVPRIYWMGVEHGWRAMVMDALGTALDELLDDCGDQFSLKTVLMLAGQMITRVENLHRIGFIHRDIKPENFLMGRGRHRDCVYLVDMGLAKRFLRSGEHIPYKDNKSLTGTARYASANALAGVEQSRRDDLISLGYVFLYLLRGHLPWQGLKAAKRKEKYAKITELKQTIPFEELCEGFPTEFVDYFRYCTDLDFAQEPDYDYLRRLFNDLYKRLGYTFDGKFDWVDCGHENEC